MKRHRRATELFLACCDMAAEERAALLRERCGDDHDLIEQVEGMVDFEEKRPDFLAGSALRGAIGTPSEELPASIGPFRILRKLGQGSAGAVYEAQQENPSRTVALKVLRPFFHSPDALRRFEHEAEFLARLQHPGIAQIFDSGRTDTESGSLPYFALELVRGDPLTVHARQQQLSLRARLELLALVADAVQHAHQHGVIHRDLKPANILVEESGQPKVLDFGIARASDSDIQLATQQTDVGQILGTLAYMSPEQTFGDPATIDTRSDVYSLGVLLYELIADQLPYDVSSKSLLEAVRVIQEEAPARLSAIDSAHRGDLETIVRTALEKDKERRYASAAALATDIRHYLRNEPIAARPPSRVYTLSMLVRRNKALTGSMVVALLALVAGLVASLVLWARAVEAAVGEKRRADEVLRLALRQDYEDLVSEAGDLWPVHPNRVEPLRTWLSEANGLIDQVPSLMAKRDELRALALPQTDEERLADREGHVDLTELQTAEGELAFRRRALIQRRDGESAALPEVDWSAYPSDTSGLYAAAAPLVSPERESFGDEPLALALLLHAMELVTGEAHYSFYIPLSQAYFSLGLDDKALRMAFVAMERAPERRKSLLDSALISMEEAVTRANSAEGLAEEARGVEDLESLVSDLRQRVSQRQTWVFPEELEATTKTRWWHNQLTGIIDALSSLSAPGEGLTTEDGVSSEHGWSVQRRIALAEQFQIDFAPGGRFALRWEKALPAIHKHKDYSGFKLAPQMGLVPIGPDPGSGFWEFWHIQSGTEPFRGEGDKLVMEESSGLVFVLLPGGPFWMGAQNVNPTGPNYDGQAVGQEGPPHEVELSPFLLSKYEFTQGQWQRLSGSNPSRNGPGKTYSEYWNSAELPATLLEPVEQVGWWECRAMLRSLGMELPSEAQWEYGARGGTQTSWWSGSEKESLRGVANLADSYGQTHGAFFQECEEWLDDGYTVHAPVDTLRPNPFGLHHVTGNVWEWCLDGYQPGRIYTITSRMVDPVTPFANTDERAARGSAFDTPAFPARTANRYGFATANANPALGLRPARALEQ